MKCLLLNVYRFKQHSIDGRKEATKPNHIARHKAKPSNGTKATKIRYTTIDRLCKIDSHSKHFIYRPVYQLGLFSAIRLPFEVKNENDRFISTAVSAFRMEMKMSTISIDF